MLLLEDKLGKIAEDLLDILPYEFGMHEEWYDFYDLDCADDIAAVANKYYGRQFWGECGVSKAVIIPINESYVIKMPFNGQFSEESYCYDEDGEYDYEDPDYYFEEFCYAGGPDSSNYCEAEYYYYKKAIEWGIDCLFARTQKINDRVYIQEKILFEDECEDDSSVSEASSKSAHKLSDEKYCPVDIYWLATVIEKYGNDMAEKLLDFFDHYGIHDIHNSNRGWRENGDPVLSDFSSWDN